MKEIKYFTYEIFCGQVNLLTESNDNSDNKYYTRDILFTMFMSSSNYVGKELGVQTHSLFDGFYYIGNNQNDKTCSYIDPDSVVRLSDITDKKRVTVSEAYKIFKDNKLIKKKEDELFRAFWNIIYDIGDSLSEEERLKVISSLEELEPCNDIEEGVITTTIDQLKGYSTEQIIEKCRVRKDKK